METTLFSIFLGIIQGVTEFLPISSSGHLAFFENLPFFRQYTLEIEKSMSFLTFNIFLHSGTLLAMLLYWRKDITKIIKDFFEDVKNKNWKNQGFQLTLKIALALSPLLIVPFIKKYVDDATHSIVLVGIFFICNGILLISAEIFNKKRKVKFENCEQMGFGAALLIGIFQFVAVLPGISRAGATISAGNLTGLASAQAVRFSFLIGIPTLLAATLFEAKDLLQSTELTINYTYVLSGSLASFLSGLLAIKLLVWLGHKSKFSVFGVYTMVLGAGILLFFWR